MIDVLIPSNKKLPDVFVQSIIDTAGCDVNIITSGFDVSAATNRNYCLNASKSAKVIMVDDDVEFTENDWAVKLINTIGSDVIMASARLMDVYGKPGTMMAIPLDLSGDIVDSPCKALPSACIAFMNSFTRFDENYQGAGYEDTDFCAQLSVMYPTKRFVINNTVKVTHKNEMKNYIKNGNDNYINNKRYFEMKWNVTL